MGFCLFCAFWLFWVCLFFVCVCVFIFCLLIFVGLGFLCVCVLLVCVLLSLFRFFPLLLPSSKSICYRHIGTIFASFPATGLLDLLATTSRKSKFVVEHPQKRRPGKFRAHQPGQLPPPIPRAGNPEAGDALPQAPESPTPHSHAQSPPFPS